MSSSSSRIEGVLILNISSFRNSINEAINLLSKLSNINFDKVSQKNKSAMDKISKDAKNAADSSEKDLQKINTVDFSKLGNTFKTISDKISGDALLTADVSIAALQKIANNPDFSNLGVEFKSTTEGISSDATITANIATSKLQEINQADFSNLGIQFKSVTDKMATDSKAASTSILSDLQNIDSGLSGMLMGAGAALGMDKLFKEAYGRASMMWRLNNQNAAEAQAILKAYTDYDISSARPDHDLVKMMEWIINSGEITAANTKESLSILDALSANADPIRERGAMFAYGRYLGSGYESAKMAFRDEGLTQSQLDMLKNATTYEERLAALKQLGIERGTVLIGQNGEIIGQYNTMEGEIGGYNQALALLDVIVQSATLSFMGLMDFIKPVFKIISDFAEANQGLVGGLVVGIGGFGILTGAITILSPVLQTGLKLLSPFGKGLKFLADQMKNTGLATRILTPLLDKLGLSLKKNSETVPDIPDMGKTTKNLSFKDTIKGDLKGIARGTVGAAAGIAAGMFLATEALLLLQAPMWALAELGKSFKAQEASIKAGGEAFKIVGSVLAVVLPPIIAFTYLMGTTGNGAFTALAVGSLGAVAGIVIAMGLATEALYLMKAPLWAIGELGKDFIGNQGNIKAGLNVIKLTSDTLVDSAPLITAFSLAVLLFGSIPLAGLFAAASIAITLGLLNMAIDGLKEPLRKIGELGGEFNNLDQVKAGADAIKRAAEAVGYIADIKVDIAKMNLADGISTLVEIFTGQKENLKTLTAENGVLADIKEFINNFNKATEGMPSINNVGALKNVVAVVKDISSLSTDIEKALTSTNKAKGEALFLNGLESGDDSPFNAMGKIIESTINFTRDLKSKLARLPELGDVSSQMTSLKNVNNVVQQVGNVVKEMNTAMSSLNSLKSTSSTSNYSSMDNIGLSFITGILGKDNGGSSPFVKMGKMIESIINFMKDINLKLANVPEIDSGAIERFRSLTSQFGYVKNDIINITNGLIAFNNVGSEYGDSPFNRMGNMVSSVINFMNNIKMYMTQATDVGEIGSTFRGIASQFGYIANDVTRISNQLVLFNSSGTDYGDKPFERMGKLVEGAIAFIKDINSKLSNAGDLSSSASGITSAVQAISTAINQIKTALNNAAGIEGAAKNLGAKIPAGIKAGIGNGSVIGSWIISTITTSINSKNSFMQSSGKRLGTSLTNGFKSSAIQLKTIAGAEVDWALNAINSRASKFWTAGARLGSSLLGGYKSAQNIASPGLVAKTTAEEMNYTLGMIESAIPTAYATASMLGQNIVSGFGSPSLEVGDTEGLNQVQTNAQTALGLVQNTANTTTSTFAGVDTTLQGSFAHMALNARNTFTGVNTTSTAQMKDMAGKTGSEIGNIKSSWVGMQEAFINSASHIRSQTGKHIDKLQGNMASFWRKVRSPVLLLGGAAGGYAGNPAGMSRAVTSSIVRPRLSRGGYAGGSSDKDRTGNNGLRLLGSASIPCFDPEGCYAGWEIANWTPSLKTSMGRWNTNFGHVYDPYLNVGKFANSNFPVKGNANVFKAFILDAIGRTSYDYYYNSKGGSPASIYSSGSFNCWDGYRVVEAFANAFGLPCSMERGMWGSDRHVWANVGGVGRVDATAIQNSHGASLFNSSAVRSAGPSPSNVNESTNKTVTNKNTFEFKFNLTLPNVTNAEELVENMQPIMKEVAEKTFTKYVNDHLNGE